MSVAKDFIVAYRDDPLKFIQNCLKVEPDPWQKDFLEALATPGKPEGINRKMSLRSGHGCGKSTVVCWALLWHILFRFPQKSVVTAPSEKQLDSAVWPDLKAWIDKLPASLGQMLEYTAETVKLQDAPNESFIRKAVSRPDQPSSLSGVHADHVMLCVDEAAGVPEKVYQYAYGSLSSESAKIILTGNPTHSSGYFFDSFHSLASEWHNIHISCLDSPRVGEDSSYVREMKILWGEDHSEYAVRVLGDFPHQDDDCFIDYDTCQDSIDRDIMPGPESPVVWGLDVARKGQDLSALCKRRSNKVMEPLKTWKGLDLMQLSGAIIKEWDDTPDIDRPSECAIDSIGLGAGVFDALNQDGRLPVRGVNVSTKPADTQYLNLRAELWGKAKEWIESKITRLDDPKLAAELTQVKYFYTSTSKLQIESKESMRSRGLRSVDLADAFCLTFAATPIIGWSSKTRWNQPLERHIGGIE